jgi:CRP-like cAMP-binding protein
LASLADDIDLMRRVPLLAGFGDEPLKLIAFSAEDREFDDGRVLFEAGDRADGGWIVASGRVDLTAADGRVLETVGPGGLIGEIALIVETQRPARAVVVGRARAILVRRALFRRVLSEFPDLASQLARVVSKRIQDTAGGLKPVADRLDAID